MLLVLKFSKGHRSLLSSLFSTLFSGVKNRLKTTPHKENLILSPEI